MFFSSNGLLTRYPMIIAYVCLADASCLCDFKDYAEIIYAASF
jgi:hypothetical protein